MTLNVYTECSNLHKKMPTHPLLRLALTPEVQEILDKLKLDFPAMKDTEIIKMALSMFANKYYLVKPDEEKAQLELATREVDNMASFIANYWKDKKKNKVSTPEEIDANSF